MEITKYQKIEVRTTYNEDQEIDKVLTLLTEVKLAMEKNNCTEIHTEFYECETDYHISELKEVIDFLENFKTIEEVY